MEKYNEIAGINKKQSEISLVIDRMSIELENCMSNFNQLRSRLQPVLNQNIQKDTEVCAERNKFSTPLAQTLGTSIEHIQSLARQISDVTNVLEI